MDPDLIRHLSDTSLAREAARLGVDVEGHDRAARIVAVERALRAAAAEARRATTARPTSSRVPPAPKAKTPPRAVSPAPREPRLLRVARSLFGRVKDLARTTLERNRPPPPPPRLAPPEEPAEPIRTLTMARLLLEQGHAQRARTMLLSLTLEDDSEEVASALDEATRAAGERWLAARARETLSPASPASQIRILEENGLRGVVWAVGDDALRRGEALLPSGGAPARLTLRVVTVVAREGGGVESEQVDQAEVDRAGSSLIIAAAHARVIVSVGLTRDEQFVSLVHTSTATRT